MGCADGAVRMGKTTLINVLGGLDTLTSGRVIVDGVDLSKLSESEMVRYRAEKIGFVFQNFNSYRISAPWKTSCSRNTSTA